MNRRSHRYSDPVGNYASGTHRHADSEIYYQTERDTIVESSHPHVPDDHPYHETLRRLRTPVAYRPELAWRTRLADRIIEAACWLARRVQA